MPVSPLLFVHGFRVSSSPSFQYSYSLARSRLSYLPLAAQFKHTRFFSPASSCSRNKGRKCEESTYVVKNSFCFACTVFSSFFFIFIRYANTCMYTLYYIHEIFISHKPHTYKFPNKNRIRNWNIFCKNLFCYWIWRNMYFPNALIY